MYIDLGKLHKKKYRKSIYQKILYKGRQFPMAMISLDRKKWGINLIELLFAFKADRYRKKPRQLPLEHGRDGSSDHRKNFGHFYERELDEIPHPHENLDVNWSPT